MALKAVLDKTLTEEQSTVLIEATVIHNAKMKQVKQDHVDLTPEQYLADMIDRQIEGLQIGVQQHKPVLDANKIIANAHAARLGLTGLA